MPSELTRSTGSSTLKACFNGTNAFLGVGLLTIPYALSSGGWLSSALFLLISIMSFYTGILLKRCMDTDSSIKSYLDIAEHAFGKRGRIIASIVMNAELYLVAVGLLILEGDNLHKLFPSFMVKIGKMTLNGRHSFVIITALVILPSMFITNLSILSYVSATGVFSCIVILVSIFCAGAINGVGFHARGSKLFNISGIPTALGLYIVCFGGHAVIPSIYTSMKSSYQFIKVLLFSFLVSTSTYLLMAIVCYLIYGDSTESQIILNLPTGQVSAKVAIYASLLIPVTRYALMVTPVADAIENGLSEYYKSFRCVRIVIRMVLLISTLLVAYVFPYYESLMAIVGSIFVVLGSVLIPCVCYLKMFDSYRSCSYELIGIIGIVLFASIAGILGTYSSISQFVKK